MKVHNTLGNGFQEVIYQRCLAIELSRAGLIYAREVEQTIFYEDIEVGTRRADFIIENQINFGSTSLQFKKIYNSNMRYKSRL